MTPPIKPRRMLGVARKAQKGVESLARRPTPVLDTFEWAYFRARWTGDAPIANLSGTSQIVDWGPKDFGPSDEFTPGWEIFGNTASAGTDVFRPRDTGGSTTVTDTELVRQIDILRPGKIWVTWGLAFDLTGDAVNGDVYSFFTELQDSVDLAILTDPKAAPSGVSQEGFITTSFNRTVPLLDPFASGTQTIQLRTQVSWSGPTSGEDVTDGFIDISWVGISTASGTI